VIRHLLDVTDLAPDEVELVLDIADRPVIELGRPLDGLGVALVFEKPSNRTRHSTEMAVVQLGGHPVYARGEEVGIDVREPAEDIARMLAGYHAVLAARVYDHGVLQRMAGVAGIPVVNMLSDRSHPLQALADALTMRQLLGALAGRTVAWIGDYNNVARSLGEIAALSRMHLRYACPPGFDAGAAELERLVLLGAASVAHFTRPADAACGADAVHTDTWVSMGQESDEQARVSAFEGFTVDESVMAAAADGALFMHCLPAHRGQEVTATVIDGPSSAVVRQGHNRLHATRAALAFCVGAR
jgi:ornithine carbamoyltransferase